MEADRAARHLVCVVPSLGLLLIRAKEADRADGFLLRAEWLSQALGQMSARCCRGRVPFKETIKRNYRNI